MSRFLAALLAFLGIGCGPKFTDTVTPAGIPNLVQFAPKMWRMGQPPNAAAWEELVKTVGGPGEPVLLVKLNDDGEGDDGPASGISGWTVEKMPIPPEDDKPWTVVDVPDPKTVARIIQLIIDAHDKGIVTIWHCTAGRDRTGMISGLLGMHFLGWSKDQAWSDMLKHGFRWELPDLDIFWAEDVVTAALSRSGNR